MDETILEIQRKLRGKSSEDVLEGIQLAGQLAALPGALLSDLLEVFTRDLANFVHTEALRAIGESRTQERSVAWFLTSSIQNATLKAQNKNSRVVPLNSNCLSFALAAAMNFDVPGPELVAAVLAFVKVATNHENFILCLEFLHRRQTAGEFHKLVEELGARTSTVKIVQRLFNGVGKTRSEFRVIDDDRVFAICFKAQSVSRGFQKVMAEVGYVGRAPASLSFKVNLPSANRDSSPEKCPNCRADRWRGRFWEGPSVLKCEKCSKFYLCTGHYSANAPGHEEHNRTVYALKPIGAPGANRRCPCGSGLSFARCCKGT